MAAGWNKENRTVARTLVSAAPALISGALAAEHCAERSLCAARHRRRAELAREFSIERANPFILGILCLAHRVHLEQ